MNTIDEQLQAITDELSKNVPQEILEVFQKSADDLMKNSPAGLSVGVKAPDFTLEDATLNKINLYKELENGPIILVFYRGEWCPYCNIELSAYQKELKEIQKYGGKLIAISPQMPNASLTMQEKHKLKFNVLSDIGNQISNKYKLTYQLQDYLIEAFKSMGIPLPDFNGDESWQLPIPATYIINREGFIEFAFTNPDHTKRANPVEVINKLKFL